MGRKKSKDQRPSKAPLKLITEHNPTRGRSRRKQTEHRLVGLECGHTAYIGKNAFPQRTRCYDCLDLAKTRWDEEHICKHGVISTDHYENCKNCRIEELEAEVERLRALVESYEATDGTTKR